MRCRNYDNQGEKYCTSSLIVSHEYLQPKIDAAMELQRAADPPMPFSLGIPWFSIRTENPPVSSEELRITSKAKYHTKKPPVKSRGR